MPSNLRYSRDPIVSMCLKLKYKSQHSTQVQCGLCFEVHNMKHDTYYNGTGICQHFFYYFLMYSQVIAYSHIYLDLLEQRVHEIYFC